MKNILIIVPWLPYPLSEGGNQAMYNNIKTIKNDFNVTVMYSIPIYCQNECDRKKLEINLENVQIIPFVYNPRKNIFSFTLKKVQTWIENFRLKKEKFDYYCSKMKDAFSICSKEYADFIQSYVKKK